MLQNPCFVDGGTPEGVLSLAQFIHNLPLIMDFPANGKPTQRMLRQASDIDGTTKVTLGSGIHSLGSLPLAIVHDKPTLHPKIVTNDDKQLELIVPFNWSLDKTAIESPELKVTLHSSNIVSKIPSFTTHRTIPESSSFFSP